MTEERTGTLEVSGGARLFFRSRETDGSRGRLLAVHGLGEHSGRFGRIAACAAVAGLDYFALDLRGHGRSPGRRGHTGSFDRLLTDLDRLRRRTGTGEPKLPTFLLGHSLGGLIVGRYVQEFGFPSLAGAVLVAPYVDLAMSPPAWKLRLSDVADRLVPSLTMDNEIRADMLFRTEEEQAAHQDDPLVHHRLSARLWGDMRRQAAILVRRADQTRTPILVQVSGDDRVVSAAACHELASRFGGDTRVIEYEEAYHDLFRDPAADRAASDLVRWIGDILAGRGGAGVDAAV
ncbi:MAG: lysophospholipase [Gemmatimonadota bacterium]